MQTLLPNRAQEQKRNHKHRTTTVHAIPTPNSKQTTKTPTRWVPGISGLAVQSNVSMSTPMPRVSADPWRRRQVSLLSRYSILSSGSAPLPTASARAAQPASPILLPSWSRISSFGTTAISGACQAPHSRHGPRGGTRQDTSQQSTITTLAWWLAATLTRHALANAARTRNKELLGMEILTRLISVSFLVWSTPAV